MVLQAYCGAQLCGFVGALPGELGLFAAKVAVGGGFAVDGALQIEHLDNAFRAQVEMAAHDFNQLFFIHFTGAEGVDGNRGGQGDGAIWV